MISAPRAYYNEINPFAAQWLRNLIAAGHIADGDVDERSITEVRRADLAGYTQCHFFAGIGVWSYSLRRAGWPDDRPVWTGSCPCQPFSAAGKKKGFDDERHLWPVWFRLITGRDASGGAEPANDNARAPGGAIVPDIIFGEQVASSDGLTWLDVVHADLEGAGYAVGAADLCAAGVGAPHLRQRLWFVADSERGGRGTQRPGEAGEQRAIESDRHGAVSGVGDANEPGPQGRVIHAERGDERAPRSSFVTGVGHGAAVHALLRKEDGGRAASDLLEVAGCGEAGGANRGPTAGFWADAEWLYCRDSKYRAVEPGTFPLAHGITGRVGRLRAYGNAIVAPAATEVIRAYLDSERTKKGTP